MNLAFSRQRSLLRAGSLGSAVVVLALVSISCGRDHKPVTSPDKSRVGRGFRQTGLASWYGPKFTGALPPTVSATTCSR